MGWWTLILWLMCCKDLLCSGLIYLPQRIGNSSAMGCCVQTQSCYARLTFSENCKLQWTVYLLCLLFMFLLIYLSIHPPKSNSQLETSKCGTNVSMFLLHSPRSYFFWQFTKFFVSIYKAKKLNCAEQVVICWITLSTGYKDGQKSPATYFWDKNCNRNCGFLLHCNKSIFKMYLHLYALLMTHLTKGESYCSKPYGGLNNCKKGLIQEMMIVDIVQVLCSF